MNFLERINDGGDGIVNGVVVWPAGQTRYYLADPALTCNQVVVQFEALSLAQKVAQTTTVRPLAAAGFVYTVRNCNPVIPPPTGPTTGPYTYTGQVVGGYPSTNTGILNLQVSFQNGRVYLTDTATPGGGTPKYLINSNRFVSTLNGLHFPPNLPILVQKFMVDLNRPEMGSQGVPGWRDNPVINASQLVRVL